MSSWQNNLHMQASAKGGERGVGLVEVLIALIVISFGVLGMAGLQLTGMKNSADGFNRAKATLLTENMAVRMRINQTGVKQGQYDNFDSSTLNCTVRPDPYCQTSHEGAAAKRCDVAQLAQFDLFSVACGEWSSTGATGGVSDVLPGEAKLSIDCDDDPCNDDSSYTLVTSWSEVNGRSSDDAQRTRRIQMRLRP